MKRLFLAACAALAFAGAACAELVIEVGGKPADPAAAETFRTGYLQGSGITYVRMPDATGNVTLYRYGDDSRKDVAEHTGKVTYWLYVCSSPRLIVLPDDAAQVASNVEFIRPGDPGYGAAKAEYRAGCYNPWVFVRDMYEDFVRK